MADRQKERTQARRRTGGVTVPALRAFVAVVETGSFSGAARQLAMSQPNVSLQIANLEEACGIRLLQRGHPATMTEAARDLYVRARLILSRVDEFENTVRDLRDLQRGRLSIGFSSPPAALRLIAAFQRAHPGIELVVSHGNTDELLRAVAACGIDVGIMTLIDPPPTLSCTLIARQRLVACLPAGHRLAAEPSVSLQALLTEKLVMREPGSMTRQLLERALAGRKAEPVVALQVMSREAMKEAVAAGIGIGAVLDDEAGRDARLAILPIADAAPAAGVYAVCLRESLDLPAVAGLVGLAAA